MNFRTHARLALLLPALLFGSLLLLSLLPGDLPARLLPSSLAAGWSQYRFAVEMGGIQYLALALLLGWRVGAWSARDAMLHFTLAPVYYAVLVLVSLFLYGQLAGDPIAEDVGIFIALLSVTYGYVYVAVLLGGFYLLNRLNTA